MGSCLCICLTGPGDEDGSRSRMDGNGAAHEGDRHYLDCDLFVRSPALVDKLVLETLDNVRTLVDM